MKAASAISHPARQTQTYFEPRLTSLAYLLMRLEGEDWSSADPAQVMVRHHTTTVAASSR